MGVWASPLRMRLQGKFPRSRLVKEERRKKIGHDGALVFAIFGKDEVLSFGVPKYYIADTSARR